MYTSLPLRSAHREMFDHDEIYPPSQLSLLYYFCIDPFFSYLSSYSFACPPDSLYCQRPETLQLLIVLFIFDDMFSHAFLYVNNQRSFKLRWEILGFIFCPRRVRDNCISSVHMRKISIAKVRLDCYKASRQRWKAPH